MPARARMPPLALDRQIQELVQRTVLASWNAHVVSRPIWMRHWSAGRGEGNGRERLARSLAQTLTPRWVDAATDLSKLTADEFAKKKLQAATN